MTDLYKNNSAKIILVTAITLTVLAVVDLFTGIAPSPSYSIVSILIFALFALALAFVSPVSFVLLLPYIFFRGTTLLSGIAIEFGGYMEDIATQGEATGAYTRLTVVYIVFTSFASLVIETLYGYFKPKEGQFEALRQTTQKHLWVPAFFAILILFSLYMMALGAKTGFPLLTGTDRLLFREESGRAYLFYMSNRFIAALLLGIIIYICTGLRRLIAVALFLWMFVISILFGEKFTSIVLIGIYIVTPAYLMSRRLQKQILMHLVPAILGVAVLTIPIILTVYDWQTNPHEAMEKLSNRMVGQGELWFVADRDTDFAFNLNTEAITHNLKSFVTRDPNTLVNTAPYIGVQYFMYSYMENKILLLFTKLNYLTLTFGMEPYFLAMFGWVGMYIPLLLCATFYAAVLAYLAWGIQNARPISIFAAGKMLIWTVVGLAQGYLYLIFGFKMLILIAITIAYEIVAARIFEPRAKGHAKP